MRCADPALFVIFLPPEKTRRVSILEDEDDEDDDDDEEGGIDDWAACVGAEGSAPKVIRFCFTGAAAAPLSATAAAGAEGGGGGGIAKGETANEARSSPRSTAEADAVVEVESPPPKFRGLRSAVEERGGGGPGRGAPE